MSVRFLDFKSLHHRCVTSKIQHSPLCHAGVDQSAVHTVVLAVQSLFTAFLRVSLLAAMALAGIQRQHRCNDLHQVQSYVVLYTYAL